MMKFPTAVSALKLYDTNIFINNKILSMFWDCLAHFFAGNKV